MRRNHTEYHPVQVQHDERNERDSETEGCTLGTERRKSARHGCEQVRKRNRDRDRRVDCGKGKSSCVKGENTTNECVGKRVSFRPKGAKRNERNDQGPHRIRRAPAHPDRCQRVATTQKHKDPPTRARLGRSVHEHEYETNEGSAYRPRAHEGKHNEPARRENERGGGHWGKEKKQKTDLAIRLAGRHPAQPMRGRDGEWMKDNWRRSDGWERDEGRDNAICSSESVRTKKSKGHRMHMQMRGGQVKLICVSWNCDINKRGKDSHRGTYYRVWFAFALSISRCWT
ncbi:hypothetical protein K438DRAFT_1944906 [Mycena galopus ATCC 62051]|nr:hypothetical protein K438DRAFT_1944906 [Mycena galopus ATCC 62051]